MKIYSVLFTAFLTFTFQLYATNLIAYTASYNFASTVIVEDDTIAYRTTSKKAYYKDSIGGIEAYISRNIQYPDSIDVNGEMVISFIVEKDGNLSHFKVIKSLHPVIDTQIIFLLEAMPSWQPGIKDDAIVRSYHFQKILYSLEYEIDSQDTSSTINNNDETIHKSVRAKPAFIGGDKALQEYLSSNLRFPEEIDTHGVIPVQFVVEKDGSVSHIKVLKSLHPLLDAEAARLVRESPRWSPGLGGNNNPVRSYYLLQIQF